MSEDIIQEHCTQYIKVPISILKNSWLSPMAKLYVGLLYSMDAKPIGEYARMLGTAPETLRNTRKQVSFWIKENKDKKEIPPEVIQRHQTKYLREGLKVRTQVLSKKNFCAHNLTIFMAKNNYSMETVINVLKFYKITYNLVLIKSKYKQTLKKKNSKEPNFDEKTRYDLVKICNSFEKVILEKEGCEDFHNYLTNKLKKEKVIVKKITMEDIT